MTGRLSSHLGPIAGALLAAMVVIALCGFNPFESLIFIFRSALGSPTAIAQTCSSAAPLVLLGLATGICFRSGVFNVGLEGCFVLGGLAAAVTAGHCSTFPAPLAILFPLLAGSVAGSLWMLVPAWLVVFRSLDDVVTTLMVNFVAMDLAAWLVERFFLAPGSANSATAMIPAVTHLPDVGFPGLNLSFIISIICVALYAAWCSRGTLGYETRIVGWNRRFARATGFGVRRILVSAMLLSGGIGGLAGAVHTLGTVHQYVTGFSAEYGFLGLTVAILGDNRAPGIFLASLLLAMLVVSGIGIQLISDFPEEVTRLIEASFIIFASVHFTGFGRRLRNWREGSAR